MKIKMLLLALLSVTFVYGQQAGILPEHPRPDFERSQWINLNGDWDFKFDPQDVGIKEGWEKISKSIHKKFMYLFLGDLNCLELMMKRILLGTNER